MSDWLALVVKIGKVDKLPNSDFLSITTVMKEYPVIFKTGDFKEGDLAAFFSYDTVVPDTEQFYFLAPKEKVDGSGKVKRPKPKVGEVPEEYRTIKAKRLRNTYSEGLLVPCPPGFKEGDSVIEYFALTKRVYEEEKEEVVTQNKTKNSIQHEKGPFQFPKYDLEGMAKYGYAFEDGEEVLISEKLEGQFCAYVYSKNRLWVRSRNHWKSNLPAQKYHRTIFAKWLAYIKQFIITYIISLFVKQSKVSNSEWWDIPIAQDLESSLKKYPDYMFCGEWYGNVPKFPYDCKMPNGQHIRRFRVFDIFNVKTKRFLEWDDVVKICADVNLDTAPILYRGPWISDRSLHALAEGTSVLNSSHPKEGFVMRSIPEQFHSKLGRKIIKLKGRDYKLFKD